MTRLRAGAGAALCLLALTIVTVESVSSPSVARKPPRAPRRQEEPLSKEEEEPLAQAGEEPLGQGEGEVKPKPVWLKMEAEDPNLPQPGSGAVADEYAGAAVFAGEVQEIALGLPDAAQAEGDGEGNIQELDVEGTGGQDAAASANGPADAKTPSASWFPSTRCSAGVQHTTQATPPEVPADADADDGDSSPLLSTSTGPADVDTTLTPAHTTTTRARYIGPGTARPPDHYLDDV